MAEIWKKIPGFETKYAISNYGRVKSFINTPNGEIIKFSVNDHGYYSRSIRDISGKVKCVKLHKVVATLFIANPNGYPIINHLDGDKLNNHHTNLVWTTAIDNVRHAINTGLRKRGSLQVLSDDDVRKIRNDFENTDITLSELSKKYGVSKQAIYHVLIYKTFSTLDPELMSTYRVCTMSKEEFEEKVKPICQVYKYKKKPPKTIEEKLNVTKERLDELVSEYINGTVDLNTFTNKHNLKKATFKKYIQSLKKLPIILQENEIFKDHGKKHQISNMGRIFSKTDFRFKIIHTINHESLDKIIARLFDLPKPSDNVILKHIDGDKFNNKLNNLKWVDRSQDKLNLKVPKEIKDTIIKKYTSTETTLNNLSNEYNLSYNLIKRIIGDNPKYKPECQVSKELVDAVRDLYFNQLNSAVRISNILNISSSLTYSIINDKYFPDSKLLKANIQKRKQKKADNAKQKILDEKERRKEITKKKKEETKRRQEYEKEKSKEITKKKREEKYRKLEQELIDKNRPITKTCHACFKEKNTVRDFSVSKNLWDNRNSRCKECVKNNIVIPDILNMDLPDDHPLVIKDWELEKEYRRQRKIIEEERIERQQKHLKDILNNIDPKK